MFTLRRTILTTGIALVLASAIGCGDDEETTSGAGAAGATGGSGGAGPGGAGPGGGGSGGSGGAFVPTEWAAVIRGTLADMDLAMAKATHDQIAMGGEQQAKMAGDIAHDVLLGTTLLDSVENEFLAIDRWTDPEAMQAFYADPMVQQAFAGLFAAPPSIQYFVYHPDWEDWGDMESGDAFDPYFFHFAIGVLASMDTAENQAAHDMVAAGGKEPSMQAGNVAHVIFLGLEDERQFLAVDIWQSDTNMEAFYTNPDFVAAFAPLFESVSQPVFQSTDWYQW
jgi:quinol monooxygenase YgiN